MENENCVTCRFFLHRPGATLGKCRRWPAYVDHQPIDWCGEYKVVEYKKESSLPNDIRNTNIYEVTGIYDALATQNTIMEAQSEFAIGKRKSGKPKKDGA